MRLTFGQKLRLGRGAVVYGTVDRAAHTLARLRYALPDAQPARHHVFLEPNVPYATSKRFFHSLDVYVPMRAPRPAPVVMYVHGGAFASLSKDTHRVMALAIARRGYVVFNINYRQGIRYPFPAPLEDAAEALLWVHANADRFGGDPTRLAIAGESAGGNLVTALGVMHARRFEVPFARRVYDANLSLRAVLSTYPYLDLTDRYEHHPRLARWYKSGSSTRPRRISAGASSSAPCRRRRGRPGGTCSRARSARSSRVGTARAGSRRSSSRAARATRSCRSAVG